MPSRRVIAFLASLVIALGGACVLPFCAPRRRPGGAIDQQAALNDPAVRKAVIAVRRAPP
jgi:hypothetical protein